MKKIEYIEQTDSDNDDVDDQLLLDALKEKKLNKTIPHRKITYSKNNREILKYYETFLYCFNLRLKDLVIKYAGGGKT